MAESSTAQTTGKAGRALDLYARSDANERSIVVTAISGAVEPLDLGLQRYVPLAAWMISIVTLLFISLRIVGSGFVPAGDAQRHVAKVFAQKPYSEIVVMRPVYTMDHSPGWDWLLRRLHEISGWDREALMSFSIVATLLCVFLAPLPWLRRPEAWLAALMAHFLAVPLPMIRLTQARPYLITEGILIGILFAWHSENARKPNTVKLLLTSLAIMFSVWMHGAWYLWLLPLAAFFMAGAWRTGIWLATCWVAGTLSGAILSGSPIEFLKQALLIVGAVAREHVPQWLLVGEFRPGDGRFSTIVLLGIVFLLRKQLDKNANKLFSGPVFWLIALCWVLDFKADRFWADWGVPAVLVWLALQFEDLIAASWTGNSWKRIMATGMLAVPLFLDTTNDTERRYSGSLSEPFIDASQPALQGWLPESQGIFYSAQMEFFYNTFYRNPQADWRYILGMEPTLMPEDDLAIFRQIQLSQFDFKAYEPWVKKMRPQDRLEISSVSQPTLPQLEWTNAVPGIWIGRLPKGVGP